MGVIGCGHWGQNYVRVLHELSVSEVVAVCDKNKDNIRLHPKYYPPLNVCTSVDELLDDESIDAIVISTPALTHYKIAKESLLRGKHILVEKPLALNVEEGKELIRLAREKKVVLMVGHTFLYNTAIKKMKELIRKDDFGEIYYLHSTRTHLGLIRNDVNAIWDLAPHDISIFSYLLDCQPIRVSAVGGQFLGNGREDVAFVTLMYPNGIIANIHVSWVDSNKVREVVVVGSKKRIVMDDLNNLERIRIYEKGVSVERGPGGFGEFQLLLRDGDIISPKVEFQEPLKLQIQHFIECIKTNSVPITDGQCGLNVVRVMAAINKSVKQNGIPEEVRVEG